MTGIITRTTVLITAVVSSIALVGGAAVPPRMRARTPAPTSAACEAQRQHEAQCNELWSEFTDAVNHADAAYKAGDMKTFNQWMESARADVSAIANSGCGSASMPTYPVRTSD